MSLSARSTRNLTTLLCLAIALPGLSLTVTPARAASVTHTATFPLSPYLNGGSYAFPPAAIPRFDLAGNCLTSVCFQLDGGISGLIAFENYQNYPVRVNVFFTGSITLQRPNLTTLLTVQPATSTSDSMPIFDNVLDYGGTSGLTYPNVGATDSGTLCLTNNADLALFTGPGTINLPGFATDLSYQSGASSWSIGVRASATIRVTYNYNDCPVPAQPTTWTGIKSLYR